MAKQTLAVKYRPKTFDDVTEQSSIKIILQNQLRQNKVKNAYLFCGGAGTGKTTCARIFASEINHGVGSPIELDAASNNSVDDVRDISTRAKTASVESEYKVFILDECHMLSNQAWNAMLKLLEEPPMKTIFIMCTTDPQKIPKTILSRVQRYNFQRISNDGIVRRLDFICTSEGIYKDINSESMQDERVYHQALEYIAKLADGGMRDAITLLDKCLAYSTTLTVDNVITALGLTDYNVMVDLTKSLVSGDKANTLNIIEDIHRSGKDLKQFMRQYLNFTLDVTKYSITGTLDNTTLPDSILPELKFEADFCNLLDVLVKLNADIKWDSAPKSLIEAELLLYEVNK